MARADVARLQVVLGDAGFAQGVDHPAQPLGILGESRLRARRLGLDAELKRGLVWSGLDLSGPGHGDAAGRGSLVAARFLRPADAGDGCRDEDEGGDGCDANRFHGFLLLVMREIRR